MTNDLPYWVWKLIRNANFGDGGDGGGDSSGDAGGGGDSNSASEGGGTTGDTGASGGTDSAGAGGVGGGGAGAAGSSGGGIGDAFGSAGAADASTAAGLSSPAGGTATTGFGGGLTGADAMTGGAGTPGALGEALSGFAGATGPDALSGGAGLFDAGAFQSGDPSSFFGELGYSTTGAIASNAPPGTDPLGTGAPDFSTAPTGVAPTDVTESLVAGTPLTGTPDPFDLGAPPQATPEDIAQLEASRGTPTEQQTVLDTGVFPGGPPTTEQIQQGLENISQGQPSGIDTTGGIAAGAVDTQGGVSGGGTIGPLGVGILGAGAGSVLSGIEGGVQLADGTIVPEPIDTLSSDQIVQQQLQIDALLAQWSQIIPTTDPRWPQVLQLVQWQVGGQPAAA